MLSPLSRPHFSRLVVLALLLAAASVHAQDRYPHVPAQLYRVGMLEWKDLRKEQDGRRRFNVFTDGQAARQYLESYPGKDKTLYVIDKKDLARTPEGRAFLQELNAELIRDPNVGELAVMLPTEASYVATIRKNARVDFKPESPPAAAGADAVPGPGPPEKTAGSAPDPNRYPYERAKPIIYIVGEKTWDELIRTDGEPRRLTVFGNYETAREHAGGQKIYRIYRHSLEGPEDGKAFLEKQQVGKDADILEMEFSSDESYRTVLKRAKTGNDLGPVNPNWKTTGRYETRPMLSKYNPGTPDEDYGAGTFYFPTEGPEAVNFMELYKVHFIKQRDGSVLLMRKAPDGSYFPLDTRIITSDKPQGFGLFVMDAEGNFYVVGWEWLIGLKEMGFKQINHSSLPSGHPVAAAGMLQAHDGKLLTIRNQSGHYKPSNRLTLQAINALERAGLAKGSYVVDFAADDHPGIAFLGLDPRGETKVKTGDIHGPPPDDNPDAVAKAKVEEPPAKAAADDEGLLEKDEPIETPELEINRLAREEAPAAPPPQEAKPVDPPSPEVVQQIRDRIKQTPAERMDVAFMQELYQLDPGAAKIIGQIMASPPPAEENESAAEARERMAAKNQKMAEVRKTMDLQVWKEILKRRGIEIELTNQGKSNGIRSDLDYTLYYVAEEAGISIKDLIEEHGKTWQSLHQQLTPDRLEIKVMNGDEFYPDWRNEALSEAEHQVEVRRVLGELRADPAKSSVLGGFKQQAHNRALRDGWTEMLRYDPLLDKTGASLERQLIRAEGLTRDIALRYKGVHPQYNHMNALGNLIQNKGEFLHHPGNNAQDVIRRAKYFNRVINEGLGNLRFFSYDYQQLFAGALPDRETENLKLEYLRKSLGLLRDQSGKPLIDEPTLQRFCKIIDISMQIERDKVSNADFEPAKYFERYRAKAEAIIAKQTEGQDIKPAEREKLVLAEQGRQFELGQKRVLADALLAGLRHSLLRDLTPEGALRNRVRFDPATQKFVLDDPTAAKKVAFERATEVALFYELVNSLDDSDPAEKSLKRSIKRTALASAPTTELAEFYRVLDDVGKAEIDRFVAGEPDNPVQRNIDEVMRNQQARVLELLLERKKAAVERARSKGVAVDPNAVSAADVRDHILSARLELLSPYRRGQFRAAYEALGRLPFGEHLNFRESFYNNASALMLGSSAVNLTRAWQGCNGLPPDRCRSLLGHAAWSEAINYMPDMVQLWVTPWDVLGKVRKGEYGAATWQATLFTALAVRPSVGHFMLSYNIVTGSIDIVHTHFVNRIDTDLAEQALRSRPRNESGGPLREGVRARANRFPDATKSIYHGSGPGVPLFYGRYKKNHPTDPGTVTQEYLDGSVPEDKLSDAQLADLAGVEFSPEIVRALTADNLRPDNPEWRQRYSDLRLKYGFDIPFYRRMAKVYAEKYKDIQWWEKWPSPYNKDYLEECRLDVYDWYVQQPPGYKLELEGDAKFWYGDQSDEMQERIARECAVILGGIHEVDAKAKEVEEANQKAFKDAMERSYNAERDLLATKVALTKRIQEDEETAAGALDQKALELADKHKTYFSMSYPFTYATQELWPVLQFDMRSIPSHVKQPAEIALDQTITDVTVGAPSGWAPGKDYEAKFKPDAKGWVAYRPVTVKMNFAAHLLDADQKPVAEAKLDLPIVLYEPSFSGQISVGVYARGASGDSSLYPGAAVTVDSATMTTDAYGEASFLHLAAGTHAVKVAPSKGDERHGPGEGSASLVDVLVTNKDIIGSERGGQQAASVSVTLPYIPEPVAVADQKKTGDAGGGKEAKKDSAAAGQAAGNDSAKAATDSAKAKSDSAKAKSDSAKAEKDSASAKNDSLTVPDVTGMAAAKRPDSVLTRVGLKAAYEAAGNPPSKERALTVAGQKPKGGTRAKRGDVVTIALYQQFVDESVTVPDLSVFTDGSEMQAVLRHAGLEPVFGTPLPAPSKDQEFKVASQKPAAGTRVPRGTADTVTAYGRFIGIPNLLGMTSGEAAAQLQPLGLVVAAIDSSAAPPSADQAGRIYEQVPAAGAPAPAGIGVTLKQYGSVRQVPPPPPPPPPQGGEWTGTYEQEGTTIAISGSAAGLSASFTYQVGGSKGSGSWSGCQVEGNTAKCKWTAQHDDETKSGTRSGDVQVTLNGNTITGAYYENEPVFSYKEGYSAATVSSSMHEGATWPINATRK